MLRKDAKARFERCGVFGQKYTFVYGSRHTTAFRKADYDAIIDAQYHEPVLIVEDGDMGRTWWLFNEQFYWEDESLTQREVHALLLDRERKSRNRVELAVASMEGIPTGRERIPDRVKALVWNRDGGRCVKCGSQNRLEFDHIIPVSKGGSNTERNLQLLCQQCNRSKGTYIG